VQPPTAPSTYQVFVGVDIAATTATAVWLSPACPPPRPITIPQTTAGYAKLHQHLLALGYPAATILVVLEATGTYWITLAMSLAQADFAVAVINPAQAHAFAKALLKRNKTDPIDAHTLAHLAAVLQPAVWTPPPAVFTELNQRLVQRDALVELRTQVRNQRHALIQQPVVIASVRTRLDTLIHTLNQQILEVEREIAAVLQQDETWAAAARQLETITGIGQLTAAWILTTTLNFTSSRTAEQAAGYAGLVPTVRRSGTSIRGRPAIGHSGNARLRRALYLATLSATQHNPVIKAFYERLRANGKPPKVARCAAARKLLHIAWAVATKDQPFDPHYHQREQCVVSAG
jgi:transposase